MHKYKYIHVFWHDDLKFNPKIVQMIFDHENEFNIQEHFFLTPHKRVFESIKEYLIEENAECIPKDIAVINKYLDCCDWMFFHSMPRPFLALKIKRRYLNKIIWRTWGHDALGYNNYNGLKGFIKKISYLLWKRDVRKYFAIGIANIVDRFDIQNKFGTHLRLYELGYNVDVDTFSEVQFVRNEDIIHHDSINVLVGHSGHEEDHHKRILDMLEIHKDENLKLYLILSYGDMKYIQDIKQYASKRWHNKVEIITEFMSSENFARLIKKIDIAILDSDRSYALGTLTYLLYFHKKVFLSKNGILHRIMQLESIPHGVVEEIPKMTFSSFSEPILYSDEDVKELIIKPKSEYIRLWKKLYMDLEAFDNE